MDRKDGGYRLERHGHESSHRPDSRQTQFYLRIARQNQDLLAEILRNDECLRNSRNTSTLYSGIEPLAPVSSTNDAEVDSRTDAEIVSGTKDPVVTAKVQVVPEDSLDTAQRLYADKKQDIAVLNMANPDTPGGSYLSGAGAQEEALCRRSSLYLSLTACATKGWYPLPPHGAIYTPRVLVMRKSDNEECALLPKEQRWWTSVISVAGLFRPPQTEDGSDFLNGEDRVETREKIKSLLRVAAAEGKKNLVLSALGCGAFRNPPQAVAQLFKEVLQDREFRGRFQGVWFSVLDRRGSRNYDIFSEVLNDISI
jgi:uncharacterized protein (TIGR02452 family)